MLAFTALLLAATAMMPVTPLVPGFAPTMGATPLPISRPVRADLTNTVLRREGRKALLQPFWSLVVPYRALRFRACSRALG